MEDNFETKLFPPNLALSPSFAIQRVSGATIKYGRERVLTDRRFKKALEIATTAAFLLGLSKITGKSYWVMPEHTAATPDTYGVSFGAHPDLNGNVRELLSVEVTEYEAHSDGDIVSFIQRKLWNKYLPEHYILLVHANKTDALNTEEVFRELSKSRLRLGEIWMVGHLDNNSAEEFLVICLYPQKAAAFFQWEEEIDGIDHKPICLECRGERAMISRKEYSCLNCQISIKQPGKQSLRQGTVWAQ